MVLHEGLAGAEGHARGRCAGAYKILLQEGREEGPVISGIKVYGRIHLRARRAAAAERGDHGKEEEDIGDQAGIGDAKEEDLIQAIIFTHAAQAKFRIKLEPFARRYIPMYSYYQ